MATDHVDDSRPFDHEVPKSEPAVREAQKAVAHGNTETQPPNLVPNDQRVQRGVVATVEHDAAQVAGVPGVVAEKGAQEILNLLGQAVNVIDKNREVRLSEDAAGDVKARIEAAIREAENLLRHGQAAK